jgi:hypothetical protein
VSGTTRNISLATLRLASDVRCQMTVFSVPDNGFAQSAPKSAAPLPNAGQRRLTVEPNRFGSEGMIRNSRNLNFRKIYLDFES